MKNDERVKHEIKLVNSIGYTIFWFGMFAVLLYRWFYLNQTLNETLDFFIIWIFGTIITFILKAYRGVPINYPVMLSKKEQYWMMLSVSLFSGIASIAILLLIKAETKQIIGGFLLTTISTLFIFVIYYLVNYFWEKSIED